MMLNAGHRALNLFRHSTKGSQMLRQDIKDIAKPLKIPFLTHFTRAINLESIMTHGLYPKSRISELGVTPHINDQHRHDGRTESTSLSISFPNYLMFYKYRQEDPSVGWVVLLLPAYLLWRKDCAFCRYNAASTTISTTPTDELKTPQAFLDMFEDDGTRDEEALKAYDPTDAQAEVLVFDVIEPRHIKYAAFNDGNTMASSVQFLGDCEASLVEISQGTLRHKRLRPEVWSIAQLPSGPQRGATTSFHPLSR